MVRLKPEWMRLYVVKEERPERKREETAKVIHRNVQSDCVCIELSRYFYMLPILPHISQISITST